MRKYLAVLAAAVCLMAGCGQKEVTETVTEAVETTVPAESESKAEETASAESESTTEEAASAEKESAAEETASTESESTEEKETAPAESESMKETEAETSQEAAAAKTVSEIYNDITSQVALVQPMIAPDEFITNYYGIDLSSLEEYVFSMSETAISAETVVILKAREGTDLDTLKSALQLVIDQKKAEMENYLPEQFQIVDASSVRVKGNYVYLVISENEAAIVKIIEDGLAS